MVPTKFLVGTTLATNGITRVTRKGRPNYPVDLKRHLAALACEPGISVAKLALDHGINANLLCKRPTIAVLPVVQQSGLISSVNSPSFHARAMAASRRVSSW